MINRLPPPSCYEVAAFRIEALCAIHNASASSTHRTTLRNARVGGHPHSKHLLNEEGYAWDLVLDDPSKSNELAQDARILGFAVLVEGDHVHVQYPAPRPAPAPPSV